MATVEKMPMLAEGYDKLNAELKRLKIERPQIVDAIEEARAHGDLSENAEYHAAKERQGQIEASIADIEDKLSRAQIIDPRDLSGDKVVFGATVTLLDEDEKAIKYQIDGQTERSRGSRSRRPRPNETLLQQIAHCLAQTDNVAPGIPAGTTHRFSSSTMT